MDFERKAQKYKLKYHLLKYYAHQHAQTGGGSPSPPRGVKAANPFPVTLAPVIDPERDVSETVPVTPLDESK